MRDFARKIIASFALFHFAFFFELAAISAEESLEMKIVTNVVAGTKAAGLTLVANQAVGRAVLNVNGRRFETGAIEPGEQAFIPIMKEAGEAHFKGALVVTFADGQKAEAPIAFTLTVLAPLALTFDEQALDLDGGALTLRASRPVKSARYRILADTGETIAEAEKIFDAPPEDNLVSLSWQPDERTVLKLEIEVTDTLGAFAKWELTPWFVDVEHEEVNFSSGKASITKEEAPKLDRAYRHLLTHIEKYGRLVKLHLYIIGYTDTVGAPDYNQKLSERRAESIARYFKKKGIRFPILYQGFGESVLAVPTADDEDEKRNRRALYLLGGAFEPRGREIPRQNWKRLE